MTHYKILIAAVIIVVGAAITAWKLGYFHKTSKK